MHVGAFALDQFHRKPGGVTVIASRKDLHDVRVMKLRDRSRLFRKSAARRHDLDCDIAAKRNLPRHIYRAHSAAAEEGNRLKVGN